MCISVGGVAEERWEICHSALSRIEDERHRSVVSMNVMERKSPGDTAIDSGVCNHGMNLITVEVSFSLYLVLHSLLPGPLAYQTPT